MEIKLADLRHRVEIQSLTFTYNGVNEVSGEAWTTAATRWAKVIYKGATEPEIAKQKSPRLTAEITLRFYDGLTSAHRFKLGTKLFNIVGPPVPHDDETWHVCQVVELEFEPEA